MAELTPIFELLLAEDDPSVPSAHVIDRSPVEIRCLVSNNEIAEKEITMLKGGQIIKAETSTMSATLKIAEFNAKIDGGTYECSTIVGEKKFRRRLRLQHKVVLPPEAKKCPSSDAEMCKNGGTCSLLDDATKICMCPMDFAGPNCEHVLVQDFIGKNLLARTKVGVAAGGTCNLVFLFFLVVLGLLLFKERKRRRRLEGIMSEFAHQQHFESLPLVKEQLYTENVYSPESIDPPPSRSGPQSGRMVTRTNAVKKVIAPGDEDDSVQPHAS
ncbi:hypothetical protein PMAYCL1PPCAC_15690 [Pristionchus mayeri]|uniref:EGF-like domain-containing protein n=1 Tax=Pristionchus mayeri TaxID=1317129 RepID=A0AAN5HYF9_9BILA|nr:hypothetical protein PMAYCL1PPCAC_15690 [Pristionchus mayeri]